jgi:hypothetical protein
VALAGVMAETIKAAIAVLGSMASTTSSSSLAWAGSLTPRVPARSDGSCHGALLRHASRLTIEYLGASGATSAGLDVTCGGHPQSFRGLRTRGTQPNISSHPEGCPKSQINVLGVRETPLDPYVESV